MATLIQKPAWHLREETRPPVGVSRPPSRDTAGNLCRASDSNWLQERVRLAQARERERIACLLHDELGEHLVLIRLKLGEMRAAGGVATPRQLDDLTDLVGRFAQATRALTSDLAPPAWRSGLVPALESLADDLARRAGLDVRVEVARPGFDVPEPQRAVACRVVRELCLNVHKHAHASQVRIASELADGCLRVRVQDDGDGLAGSPQQVWRVRSDGGFGLASAQAQLRAFGGELDLAPAPGGGTCARFVLPLGIA